jgi:antitoxin component YwqK of YwqJK toxin-antitoxin module
MLLEEYENDHLIQGYYWKKGDLREVSSIDQGNGTATLYDAEGIFLKKISYKKGEPVDE